VLVELNQKGASPSQEQLSSANFSHLAELLTKNAEMDLFRRAKKFGQSNSENQFRSQPMTLEPYSVKLSFIPARLLPVVCARNSKGETQLTPTGKIINTLYENMEKEGVEGYVILTSGAAKEAIGLKPRQKSRLKCGSLPIKDYCCAFSSPKLDGDFTVVANEINLDEESLLKMTESNQDFLEAVVVKSKSRPFGRLDFGKTIGKTNNGIKYWNSWGHITFPEYKGCYSPDISFIEHVMGGKKDDVYILIVPCDESEGFVGVEINYLRQTNSKVFNFFQTKEGGSLTKRSIKASEIPWFETAFPFEISPSEAFAHMLHILRSSTWENTVPSISEQNNTVSLNTIRNTSIRFAQDIIYPIVGNPELIARDELSMKQTTQRLFDSLKMTLNGDPFIGTILLLAAGENPTSAPAFGMGFIDNRGIFPYLYEFLHKEDRLNRLLNIMEKCPFGKAQKGWQMFISFLYHEAGSNEEKLLQLLQPSFCSQKVFIANAKTFLFRLPEPYRRLKPTGKPGVYYPS
jgi:hypothetical protein